MDFYFDPYVFACDKTSITESQFDDYVSNLIDWKYMVDINWGRVYLLDDTFRVLHESNLYPLVPHIKSIIEKYNITHIQISDIEKIINSFLEKLPSINSEIDIIDCSFEIENSNLSFTEPRNSSFLSSLHKLIIIIALDCRINNRNGDSKILISKYLINYNIELSAKEVLFERKNEIPIKQYSDVDFTIKTYENFEEFCKRIKPSIVWLNALNEACFIMALCIQIFQMNSKYRLMYDLKNVNFYFQKSFYKSFKELHFDTHETRADMLLRALGEEYIGSNLRDTHALRENGSGGNPQISTENFDAWRRDIDREFHLHFWKKSNQYKFANVVRHNDFNISWN